MWYRIAKDGIGGGVIKSQKPEMSGEMIKFLLDQGRSLDDFYVNFKTNQSQLWEKVVQNVPQSDIDSNDPRFQTLKSQLENGRHYEEDSTNMLQVEKGKGGMSMKNGEGVTQYNSGKGDPSVFYDNLPSNKSLV